MTNSGDEEVIRGRAQQASNYYQNSGAGVTPDDVMRRLLPPSQTIAVAVVHHPNDPKNTSWGYEGVVP